MLGLKNDWERPYFKSWPDELWCPFSNLPGWSVCRHNSVGHPFSPNPGKKRIEQFQDMVNQKLDRLYKEEINFVKRNRKGKLWCSLTCQTGLKKEAKSRTV